MLPHQSAHERQVLAATSKRLLIKTPKLTMQIHSLNIACDRKSQPEFINTAPQGTVRGRSSPATKVWERKHSSFWPHGSPGAQGLQAPPGNLSATMKSLAGHKESKDATKAKPPASPPSPQPVAASGKKLGVGFKSSW